MNTSIGRMRTSRKIQLHHYNCKVLIRGTHCPSLSAKPQFLQRGLVRKYRVQSVRHGLLWRQVASKMLVLDCLRQPGFMKEILLQSTLHQINPKSLKHNKNSWFSSMDTTILFQWGKMVNLHITWVPISSMMQRGIVNRARSNTWNEVTIVIGMDL